jgi:hypothetical protein
MLTLLLTIIGVWATTLAFVLALCRIAAYGSTLGAEPDDPELERESRTGEPPAQAHPAAA